MKTLLVDTSTNEIGIGIFSGRKCLFEAYISAEKKYNAVLALYIDKAIKKAGISINDIDIFGATLGPGNFTGIRVGMAAMKSFAQTLNKKFFGATTLEILASSAGVKEGSVTSLIDARRNEVYLGKCRMQNAKCRMISNKLITREEFDSANRLGTVVVLKKHVELLRKKSKIEFKVVEHIDMKRFNVIVHENMHRIKDVDVYNTSPVYIRKSDAEINLKKGKNK